MNHLHKFEDYIFDNQLVSKSDAIILAVSGGKDSMVMTELFFRSGYNIIIAHCNFNLRAAESDLDEALVRRYASSHRLPIYVESFDTEKYADENKVSIQMAARDLRYSWFEELRIKTGAKCIAVGQHANDQIETVMLNLIRGTGLKGLNGILPSRDNIIRPMLSFYSSEIQLIASQWKIDYRDDASNFETKYSRNKARLKIIPLCKEINSEFEHTFIHNIQNFNDAYTLLQEFIQPIKDRLFIFVAEDLIKIEQAKLQTYLSNIPLLYELFNEFQFSKAVIKDFCDSWNNGSGRVFESQTHKLLFDRDYIWLKPNVEIPAEQVEIQASDTHLRFYNWRLRVETSENIQIVQDEHVAQLDYDKLIFPLRLRKWQQGDRFFPLGMHASKKISDYLVSAKLNLFEKETVSVLENGNGEIMWLMNHRIDNRYKITKNTRKVLTLVCEN